MSFAVMLIQMVHVEEVSVVLVLLQEDPASVFVVLGLVFVAFLEELALVFVALQQGELALASVALLQGVLALVSVALLQDGGLDAG